jgi:hypothetical protein
MRLLVWRLGGWHVNGRSLHYLGLSGWRVHRFGLGGRHFHDLGVPLEFGGVGATRQIDSYRMIRTILSEVVLRQFLSYFISRYPDYGVLTCIEIEGKLEEFHPERALFESAVRTADRVVDDVLKELPASLAGAKRRALQQAMEFRPHGLLT